MAKWSKDWPNKDGWYWVRYTGKHGTVQCPMRAMMMADGVKAGTSARNDFFVTGPGSLMRDNTLRFGPRIEEPK